MVVESIGWRFSFFGVSFLLLMLLSLSFFWSRLGESKLIFLRVKRVCRIVHNPMMVWNLEHFACLAVDICGVQTVITTLLMHVVMLGALAVGVGIDLREYAL